MKVWLFVLLVFSMVMPAYADQHETIKIGALQCFQNCARWAFPNRKGWELAVEEINQSGGVLGQKLELIIHDDQTDPAHAVRLAEALIHQDGVAVLTGPIYSNVTLAVSQYAAQNKIPVIAGYGAANDLTWGQGNDFTFVLDPAPYTQARAMADIAATLPAKRWATLAPNHVYGQNFINDFKDALQQKRPDIEFIAEQWPKVGGLNSEHIRAVFKDNPDALFTTAFTQDLAKLVREGKKLGVFDDRIIMTSGIAIPEEMDHFGDDLPLGWYSQGYPWRSIDTPEHKAFVEAYQQKFNEDVKLGSLFGYITIHQIAAAIEKAGSADGKSIAKAAKGLEIQTPVGAIKFREIDNRSTFNFWMGQTGLINGRPGLVNFTHQDVEQYMPPDEWILEQRKK